jgi:hypothetical protein
MKDSEGSLNLRHFKNFFEVWKERKQFFAEAGPIDHFWPV